jgi:GGDEF domain-containing protein
MAMNTSTENIKVVDHKINYNNLVFYIIDTTNSILNIDHTMGYDAIILDASDPEYARIVLKKIRSHYNPEFYLKPVFLLNFKQTKDPLLNNMHDGLMTSYEQVVELSEVAKRIFLRTTQLDNQLVPSFEGQTVKKVLNYMYTRDIRTLKPIVDLNSSIGYTYPELSINFTNTEEPQVLEILEWADREGLIWPDFYERVYLCNNCSSGALSYREVCPHCNSANSRSEDLVHHFPCAYIGPISDFQNNIDNSLNCPKCNKTLRHIGIDYDKPSVIHHCNNCDQNYQDAFIKSKCLSCEDDIDVKYLVPKTVNIYKLTRKGRSAATSGFLSSSQEVDDIFGTINMHTLKIMLHYELERVKETPAQKTTLALVHLENIFELYNKIGKRGERKLLEELVGVVRENIKSSDVIAFESSSTLYLMLTNMASENADQKLKNLSVLTENLIKKNFNGFKANLLYKIKTLNADKKAEVQLQELSKDFFA